MKAIVPTLALVIGLLDASVFAADTKAKTGTVWGVVFTADVDGGRSVVPGAKISLIGPATRETEADAAGKYVFDAGSRPSNPLLYVGRNFEFVIRRCFLPYALLFFALLNITKVAFVLSAIGANVVWPIALYSYRTFAGVQTSTVASPAPSA